MDVAEDRSTTHPKAEVRSRRRIEDFLGWLCEYNLHEIGISSIGTIVPSSRGRWRVRRALKHLPSLDHFQRVYDPS
jgi:hypothetical protein